MEYKNKNNILQINYRYNTLKSFNDTIVHKKNTLNDIKHNDTNNISQIGTIYRWQITKQAILYAAKYYNTISKQTIDQAFGLKYTNCCWSISLMYEKKIIGWNNIKNNSLYDKKISFNIILNTLNDKITSNKKHKLLHSILIPYQSIF